jgi:hypothetical protein
MRLTETYGRKRWSEWTSETQIVEGTRDPVFVRPVLHTKDGMRSHWVDIRIGALDYKGAKYSDYDPANAADKAAQLRVAAERAESSGGIVQFVIHLRKTSRRTPLTPAEARQVAHAIDEARQLLGNLPSEKQPPPDLSPNGPGPPSPLQPLADELLFEVAYLERIEELLLDRRQVIFQGPPGTGKTYSRAEAGRAPRRIEGPRAPRAIPPLVRLRGLHRGDSSDAGGQPDGLPARARAAAPGRRRRQRRAER